MQSDNQQPFYSCLNMDEWLILAAASSALMVADVERTQNCLAALTCYEINPLYGRHPSRARMYAIVVPITVAASYAGWKFRKGKHWYWWIPQVVSIGSHTVGVTVRF